MFVLFGMFFKKAMPWHFYTILAIWFSWIALGIYVGHLGYCPLTEWHWHIKRLEGETFLPPSYIEYIYAKLIAQDVARGSLQSLTVIIMLICTGFSAVKYIKYRQG